MKPRVKLKLNTKSSVCSLQKAKPNEDLISILEDHLTDAKSGELIGFASIQIYKGHDSNYCWQGLWDRKTSLLVAGCLEELKSNVAVMISRANKGSDLYQWIEG